MGHQGVYGPRKSIKVSQGSAMVPPLFVNVKCIKLQIWSNVVRIQKFDTPQLF
jgi:hypothetical protein